MLAGAEPGHGLNDRIDAPATRVRRALGRVHQRPVPEHCPGREPAARVSPVVLPRPHDDRVSSRWPTGEPLAGRSARSCQGRSLLLLE